MPHLLPPRPSVHVTAHPAAGVVFVLVESDHNDDARGGRLTLSLQSARLLGTEIDRAVREYDEQAKAA